ncbi:component of SufBCD complex [Ostreiculturibacter nitratireducens]|uniref:component of SufBCD complex n=1 Tax=Ostreiculturibacter nitratireducens TaxID=3075226 RepID=UPI0031B596EB
MDWTEQVFELIDMRSFSNLWYWIVLATVWSSASHWTLGVPYDMILRARRRGGQFEEDLVSIVKVNVNRIVHVSSQSGVTLVAGGSFAMTTLGLLGFLYRIEFCQAIFLILFPMTFVAWLSIKAANRIHETSPEGEDLRKVLLRHRLYVQVIGMASIFVTAFWGMYQNLDIGAIPS